MKILIKRIAVCGKNAPNTRYDIYSATCKLDTKQPEKIIFASYSALSYLRAGRKNKIIAFVSSDLEGKNAISKGAEDYIKGKPSIRKLKEYALVYFSLYIINYKRV